MRDMAIESLEAIGDASDVARTNETYKLKGNMGTTHLLFTVLAFTGPLGVIFGFLSYNLSFGIGVPIAFVLVTGFMLLFAVGFTNMSRRIPRPGAFYTYITMGLGRPIGLGGSFLALTTYAFNVIAAVVFGGIAVNNLIDSFAATAHYPWWIWSMLLLAAVWSMSYFNVEFSAKVLSTILVLEILGIVLFDLVVLWDGGVQGHSMLPWQPASLFVPSIGLLLLFSVGLFNGFEATAIYRDEVKEPEKTIPRATYLAVLFLGAFYALSSYALILTAGVDHAVANAQVNPAGMMPAAILHYFGTLANQIVAAMLVTSLFASMLSLQNILSRYVHSLAVDGIFSRKLAKVHPVYGSPYRSAATVGAALFASLILVVLSGADATALYGVTAGIAFYGMLLLLFLTALAVIVYFSRDRGTLPIWKAFIAPAISAIGICFVLVTATFNIEMLIVAPPIVAWGLLGLAYAAIVAGIWFALSLKRRGSDVYERIGRNVQ